MSDDDTRYEEGRYIGDYRVELLHSPGAKRPYVVRLSVWRVGLREPDGTLPSWRASTGIKIIGEPHAYKTSFKKLSQAVDFYHARQAAADYTWLEKQLQKRTVENYELML